MNHSSLEPAAASSREAQRLWEAVLGDLQVSLDRDHFRTWLRDTVGLALSGDTIHVGVRSEFIVRWLEGRLRPVIERVVAFHAGRPLQVLFEVAPAALAETQDEEAPTREEAPRAIPSQSGRPHFDPRYTFDTFVVGASNKLAFTAARSVAGQPAGVYNPLFLYGGVGLGKTHLLHAVGHLVLGQGLVVLYVSSEQFTNEFINSLRERSTEEFRQKYRSADFLLIDDIQFIAGKEQTQEEFFHTFNDLYSRHKQIVLTSDRSPKLLPAIEDRLRSRFEWGLIADIQPPDMETRVAILRSKAAEQRLQMPDSVATFIASRVQENIRELEGCLNRVVAYAQLTQAPISTELATQALAGITPARRNPPQPSVALEAVQRLFRLDADELKSKRREKKLAYARHLAMYLLYADCKRPLAEIGRLLGGRDHSTVLHGCTKIGRLMGRDPAVRQDLTDLRELMK